MLGEGIKKNHILLLKYAYLSSIHSIEKNYCKTVNVREAAKKVLLLMAGPLRGGGGGVKGLAIKEK